MGNFENAMSSFRDMSDVVPLAAEIASLGGSERLVEVIHRSFKIGVLPHLSLAEYLADDEGALDNYFEIEEFTGVLLTEL